MYTLIVQSGKHSGRRVKLPYGEVIIGRDDSSRIKIASSEVSRQHCTLTVTASEVRVADLNSRNGTYVNGVPITGETVLPPGGSLTVGPMSFQLEGEAVATPKPATFLRGSDERAAAGLSDDDIASMLSVDNGAVSTSDTTIHGEDSAVIPAVAPTPAPKAAPAKRVYRSIAEEAREIIRLHLESLNPPADGGTAE
ncbi:MAG: FHA domain-containing protein [Planctomyces sp.]|nr:FHA domain-containing protein [Planctomyces sp.]